MKCRIGVACIIALALGTPYAAIAQTIDGSAYFSPLTDNVQPLIYGNVFSKSYLEKQARRKATYPRAEVPAQDAKRVSSQRSPSSTDSLVRFDPQVSREVRNAYIDAIARQSGQQAAEGLRRYYERSDVHRLFETAVAPYGLQSDDLIDITTAYVVVMWITANESALPSRAEVQAVRTQLRDAVLSEGKVPHHAEDRQRAAESLIYQTVTLIRVREEAQAQRNADFLARLADSAQASMARHKFDLRGLSMTNYGLVQR